MPSVMYLSKSVAVKVNSANESIRSIEKKLGGLGPAMEDLLAPNSVSSSL